MTQLQKNTVMLGAKMAILMKTQYRQIDQYLSLIRRINMSQQLNKSTLDNSPPPNYDKESKDECHHVNNNPRYKWYVK